MESKSETEKRKHRCCFTGHRPERIGASEQRVIKGLEKEIRQARLMDLKNNGLLTGKKDMLLLWQRRI